MAQKTIAFFPEAAFGPALNSVGIAQAVEARGHRAVFLSDPGFLDVYKGYGFEAHPVNLSAPMPPEQMAKFWEDFINGHIPNFRKSPFDQVDNYVKDWFSSGRRRTPGARILSGWTFRRDIRGRGGCATSSCARKSFPPS